MYLPDYHLHTVCSPDSDLTLHQQARFAQAAGVRELCVTDHWNLVDQQGRPQPHTLDWSPSLRQFRRARSRWAGKVELRLGVEVGNGNLDPDAVEAALALPELDFVIGSLHSQSQTAGGLGIYTAAHRCASQEECMAVLEDYVTDLEDLARTSGYDVLGHIIYPLRYLPPQYGLTLHPWRDRLAEVLRHVIATGRGIEFNTSQGATVEQWTGVLTLYRDLGGEILTLGSDAHHAGQAGAAFPQALDLIRSLGFSWLALYRGRTPVFARVE